MFNRPSGFLKIPTYKTDLHTNIFSYVPFFTRLVLHYLAVARSITICDRIFFSTFFLFFSLVQPVFVFVSAYFCICFIEPTMFICRFVGRSSVLLLFLLLFAIVLFFLLMDTQPDKRVVRSCTVLRTTCTTVALITLLMLCVF